MSISDFINSPCWDYPFYKLLARNDTAQAAGHQGGMVFPNDLRRYLPALESSAVSAASPTVDRLLRTEMYVGIVFVGCRTVRYQLQTWGGRRTAESRLTDGMQPIYSRSAQDDLLLFQRHKDSLDFFRLILVKHSTPEYNEFISGMDDDRWGVLYPDCVPITQDEIEDAQGRVRKDADDRVSIFSGSVTRAQTEREAIARSAVFREQVKREYGWRCAISGIQIQTPEKIYEAEAAHIIPLHEGGADDPRNGIALCQTLHWAFDNGLFGIDNERRVIIPQQVKCSSADRFFLQYENQMLTESECPRYRASQEAFDWHREHIVGRWSA